MNPRDVFSVIESAYRTDLATVEWLENIAAASSRALGSDSAMAFQYDASADDWVRGGLAGFHGFPPEFGASLLNHPDMPPDGIRAMIQMFRTVRVDGLRDFSWRTGLTMFSALLDHFCIDDLIGVNGIDPSRRGCFVVVKARRAVQSPRTIHLWRRLGAHIAAGNRLRNTLDQLAREGVEPADRAEAVLAPNGKVEHATGAADPRAARESLRDALVRIDAARSSVGDAGQAIELWRALVSARWSLVEHFERNGRKYYLAYKNDPELSENRALTPRERQVLGYAELGNSNKLIAYALGLSPSTVATVLSRAKGKLGIA